MRLTAYQTKISTKFDFKDKPVSTDGVGVKECVGGHMGLCVAALVPTFAGLS